MIERGRRLFQRIVPILGLLLFGVALLVLRRELAGLSWEEVRAVVAATPAPALTLALLLLALIPARREFFREASPTLEPFSAGWIALIAGGVLATGWLAAVSYVDVKLSSDLWWSFTLAGDAPR